jgi:hypothetical protein
VAFATQRPVSHAHDVPKQSMGDTVISTEKDSNDSKITE